jgi:acetyl-CoA carboxylase beta subunit
MAEDADNQPSRPFVCVQTEPAEAGGKDVVAASYATSSVLGLAEPGPRRR